MGNALDPPKYIDKVTVIIEQGDDVLTVETTGRVLAEPEQLKCDIVGGAGDLDVLLNPTKVLSMQPTHGEFSLTLDKCLPAADGEIFRFTTTKKSDDAKAE